MTPRRAFLRTSAATLGAALARGAAGEHKAHIAITLDLEMSRNFPTWEQTHWDFEKGNLDDATKRYTLEVARRVKAHGGVVHCFVVGRVLEQENIDWLRQLVADGHPLGNHTYDHVNVTATQPRDVQFRFQREPWFIAGRSAAEMIRENIASCAAVMDARLGVKPAGFRTPGGFGTGLADRPDVRAMLHGLGYPWISSKYPRHPMPPASTEPDAAVLDAIVQAQAAAQPFAYPDGMIEVPMSPISDIAAFRTGRWKLDWYLRAVRLAIEWAIEHGAVFDLLAHPSCLGVIDPECRTVEMICDLVQKAGPRATLTDLNAIAATTRRS